MNPLVGTVWFTATGVTHASPTRCSASSTSIRYFITGASSGIWAKSGHARLLKTPARSAFTTGSRLATVSGARVSENASVSARKARPAT